MPGSWWSSLFADMSPTSFFNLSFLPKYGSMFIQGVEFTLLLAVVSVLLAVIPALVLALMRLSKNRVIKGIAGAYIAVFRSTPLLVQLSIVFFGIFGSFNPRITLFGFLTLDTFIPCAVALALNSSAYVAEIFRAGIQAVDGGQTEAARSLGLSSFQTLLYIIMPQAIRNILPAIANEFVVIIKESAITYTIGMQDIMSAVNAVKGATFIIVEPLLVATAIYFCLCFPTSKLIAYIERRMSRGSKR